MINFENSIDFLEILAKLNFREFILDVEEKLKGKEKEEQNTILTMNVIFLLIENAANIKDSLYNFIAKASLNEITSEDVKKMGLDKIVEECKSIFGDSIGMLVELAKKTNLKKTL